MALANIICCRNFVSCGVGVDNFDMSCDFIF
jgi:hypothetical protein